MSLVPSGQEPAYSLAPSIGGRIGVGQISWSAFVQASTVAKQHLPKLDVVIPVWNEVAWLERLLCRFTASELIGKVIVADNSSTDDSTSIAHRYGCVLIHGGRPARARNAGSRVTAEPFILFVDADTLVPESSIRAALHEFTDNQVVAVHFRTTPLTTTRWIRILYLIVRIWIGGLDRIGISQGIGTAIAVRSTAFHRIGGFQEDVVVGEDAVFLRNIAALGRVVYFRQHAVFTSPRRLYVEGIIVFPLKVALWTLLRLFNIKASPIPYRWESYCSALARREDYMITTLGL